MTKHETKAKYSHQDSEGKWQQHWSENKLFVTNLEDFTKPKKYILPMFPYPSGSGLHVGHVRNYTIADAAARFYRMNGFNVLTAIGWDAFGLPSEQYAIQTNNHPSVFNNTNIGKIKQQLKRLGFSYDWSKEINTSEANYYRWTQWIFKQIYLEKLADYVKAPVFWCEELGTVLSHEEVRNVNGELLSERGSFPVIRKELSQWTLRITKYANQLSNDLENLHWPLNIKNLQKNWIGVSRGTVIKFRVCGSDETSIDVFTTRADTIFGVNSVAISPLHKLLEQLIDSNLSDRVFGFCHKWRNNSNDFSRTSQQLEGEFTGSYCLNPVTMERVPIWVTNFVFDYYGTGALMVAPFSMQVLSSNNCHPFLAKKESEQNYQVDHCFSLRYGLPVKNFVVITDNGKVHYSAKNLLSHINTKEEAVREVTSYLINRGSGFKSETYHLRDWVFSRQRYWGEPIPIIHLEDGSTKVLDDYELPLKLPELSDFSPSRKYYSPLQKLPSWVMVNHNNLVAKRDVNVMPQWAGSCWYYIAFLLRLEDGYQDLNSSRARAVLSHWLPVDLYIGGQEHVNLHLLYARFWHKVLQKIGILEQGEPFQQLLCQGMILGENGEKMSKSRGNVVSPDYCVEKWGADALRLYEAFLAPVEQTSSFSLRGVAAMKKWLNRVYVLFGSSYGRFTDNESTDQDLQESFCLLVKEVTHDYQRLKLNLVIAKLMKFVNKCYLTRTIPFSYARAFIQLLNPLAPHITEELWSRFTDEPLTFSRWPVVEREFEQNTRVVVQVDGKKRGVLEISSVKNSNLLESAMKLPSVASFLSRREVFRVIEVKNKLVNIVTAHG